MLRRRRAVLLRCGAVQCCCDAPSRACASEADAQAAAEAASPRQGPEGSGAVVDALADTSCSEGLARCRQDERRQGDSSSRQSAACFGTCPSAACCSRARVPSTAVSGRSGPQRLRLGAGPDCADARACLLMCLRTAACDDSLLAAAAVLDGVLDYDHETDWRDAESLLRRARLFLERDGAASTLATELRSSVDVRLLFRLTALVPCTRVRVSVSLLLV